MDTSHQAAQQSLWDTLQPTEELDLCQISVLTWRESLATKSEVLDLASAEPGLSLACWQPRDRR